MGSYPEELREWALHFDIRKQQRPFHGIEAIAVLGEGNHKEDQDSCLG